MSLLQTLRQDLENLNTELRKMGDEYNKRRDEKKVGADLWPGESKKAWDETNSKRDKVKGQLDGELEAEKVVKRIAELDKDLENRSDPNGKPKPGREDTNFRDGREDHEDRDDFRRKAEQRADDVNLAMQSWAGHTNPKLRSERHLEACKRMGINPAENEITINLSETRQHRGMQRIMQRMHPEQRTLSSFLGTAGGFINAPQSFVSQLEINMLAYGGVEQVAEMMLTETGEPITWPTGDDTTNEGAMLGENTTIPSTGDPVFATVIWNAYDFTSGLVLAPNNLLADSPHTLASLLPEMLGERVSRAGNRKFTGGTGVRQPKGLLNCATLGVTCNSSTAIATDEIIEMQHKIDPAYRADPSLGWMMHDNTVLNIRLLKDGQGRYIWQAGLLDGQPDTLLTKPITLNQHMDSAVSSGNKTMMYGVFNKYKIRRVRAITIRKLVERFADSNQTAFLVIVRQDGNLLNAGTSTIKYMIQP